jgi:sugar phosphate isomerase/epimerase
MPALKIGIRVESLRLPLRQAIRRAGELGAKGIQIDAVGDLAPDQFGATARRDFRHLLNTLGLELTALGFPTRHGFNTEDRLEARIIALQKVLTLSFDLRAPLVLGAIGRVPEDPQHPARKLLADSLGEIGRHADRVGARYAVESGPESGATLAGFLDSIVTGGLAVNLDPANLLIRGYDPIRAVYDLSRYIAHTHVRDAVHDPASELGREVNPGAGDLDWPRYLGALEDVGYRGWFVVEREASKEPDRDVGRAVEFLRSL